MILDLLIRFTLGTSIAAAPGHHVTMVPAVAAPGAPAAVAANADAVVDEVQKFYAKINQVTALFRQSVTNNTFGSTKTSDGTILIMKPGKMRWDYKEKKGNQVKTKKSFISNGADLYVVEHDNMQVVTKNLQQDLMPVAVTFLYGKGNLKDEFTPALDTSGKYGAKGELVLKLTPKKPSAQYKTLFLVVSAKDYHVTQSIIIDSSDNVNHFRFYAPDFNKKIDAGLFEFNPKSVPTYRVINANQQPAQGSAKAPAPKAPAPAPAPAPKK